MTEINDDKLQKAIKNTLDIMEMLDPANADRVRDEMQSLTRQELIEYLINPMQIYFDPGKEPRPSVLDKVIAKEKIVLTEQVEMPHIARNKDGKGVVTRKKLTILPLYARANQQIAMKEGKAASENITRNIAGQVTGKAAKSGQFSDSELTVTIGHGLDNIMKELMGPASHDLVSKKEMKQSIIKTGEVSLKNLTDSSANKKSLKYFSEILRSMDIDTDLVEPPERW